MSDVAKLFPEVKVGGFTLRPWSVRQIADCGRPIADILAAADDLKLDLGKLFSGGLDAAMKDLKVARVLALSLPAVVDIIQITLKISNDELEAQVDPAQAINILVAIISLNADYLKNLSALAAIKTPAATGA